MANGPITKLLDLSDESRDELVFLAEHDTYQAVWTPFLERQIARYKNELVLAREKRADDRSDDFLRGFITCATFLLSVPDALRAEREADRDQRDRDDAARVERDARPLTPWEAAEKAARDTQGRL